MRLRTKPSGLQGIKILHSGWKIRQEQVRGSEMKMPWEHYKEFVPIYVESLKEFGTTREDPCLKYKSILVCLKGMVLDLSIF